MTRPLDDFTELQDLLDALCEGSIRADQMSRLEELLLAHPEAEARYVQYLNLHADVVRHFSAPALAPEALRQRLGQRPARGRPRLVWLGLGLSGLAAGLLVALALWLRPGREAVAELPEGVDDTVAVLLRAPDAVWEGEGRRPRPGDPLHPGRLRLRSGAAHIEFYSGATVILQGPADLRLVSATEAFCARGKLRATVPTQAQGFTIRSPWLDVVDRGTEFGLLVEKGNRTEVHVFRGKVEWSGPDDAPAPRHELTTGRAVRVDGAEPARPIEPDSRAFLSAGDLTARVEAETRKRQQEWEAVAQTLRKDPSLQTYFSFQGEQPGSRILHDLSRGGQDPRNGVIVGTAWVPGRWEGRPALDFRRVSDRVRFHVPGQFGSITLMTWVRVDALPHRFNSLMMTDGWEKGAPHWHIGNEGEVALGVQGGRGVGGHNYTTPPVFTPDRLGQWTCLAVVYDRADGRVTHYADGRVVAEEPIRTDVMVRIKDVELGNWNLGQRRNERRPIRYLNGCIDEFLLFSRAVGENEVRQLYEKGRPPF